jgi:hypothetical protein
MAQAVDQAAVADITELVDREIRQAHLLRKEMAVVREVFQVLILVVAAAAALEL